MAHYNRLSIHTGRQKLYIAKDKLGLVTFFEHKPRLSNTCEEFESLTGLSSDPIAVEKFFDYINPLECYELDIYVRNLQFDK